MKKYFDEFHKNQRYGIEGKLLISVKSEIQEISIIETTNYGRGLMLDHCWMVTESSDKYYHEALVHPALTGAKNIEKILIIGGGDGCSARECLKYKEVTKIELVEIDEKVISLSKKYLPYVNDKTWKDRRLEIKIADGTDWVSKSIPNNYDVIIIDGSDPKGPAEGLFNRKFFNDCKIALKNEGVLAVQTESPEAFRECHINTLKIIRSIFKFSNTLYGSVPIYPSGLWSWTFASQNSPSYMYPKSKRSHKIIDNCQIWSPRWQIGSFNTMPNFVERALKK